MVLCSIAPVLAGEPHTDSRETRSPSVSTGSDVLWSEFAGRMVLCAMLLSNKGVGLVCYDFKANYKTYVNKEVLVGKA